jgi:hypothetical protein
MLSFRSPSRRIVTLAIGLALCAFLGAVFAGGLGIMMDWALPNDVWRAAIAGGLCVLVGAMMGLPVLLAGGAGNWGAAGGAGRFAACAVASGMVRAMVALAATLVCLFVFHLDGRTLFASFLCGVLLALALETAWSMHTMKQFAPDDTGVGGSA